MEENKVLIGLDAYDELASMYERVQVVKRLYQSNPCLGQGTILMVLGIPTKKENKNGIL